MWTFSILNNCYISETFFVWFRVVLEIRLESYSPRHASVVLWCSIVCAYCKPAYTCTCTSLIGTQLHLTPKLMYIPYDRILHTKQRLLPTMHCFLRTKLWVATLHITAPFQLIVYAYIKITLRGTTLPLYEFVAKQPSRVVFQSFFTTTFL